jgi:hypothetical protein
MSRSSRFAACLLSIALLLVMTDAAHGQRRAVPRHPVQPAPTHPTHPAPAVAVRGHVFIGGYFYDPFFGPYPWWPRQTFPYWYVPIYDTRATLRLRVTPDQAAVYVDGFYAGIVDDFDSFFEGLPVTPGGHRIVLYLEGYRTVRHNLYLRAGATFTVRETLQRLPAGEKSEPPEFSPPLPPPPTGTYTLPRTPPPVISPQPPPTPDSLTVESGTLDLYVQPSGAEVRVDGQRWVSSDSGHFQVRLPAGTHRIEITRPGYRPFATTIDIPERGSVPLNVVLMPIGSA